jgi:glutathionyl-hydroquinone reductase
LGQLVGGTWHDLWYDTKSTGGKFIRSNAAFRNFITADGSAGPSGEAGFKAASGRYHLYISYACPWAHRTVIFRSLKGLEDHISVSAVHPLMLENGWTFETTDDGSSGDALFANKYMHQIYTRANPHYTGRVTVPVLWDKEQNTIVSNESSEIIRMFNSAFNDITGNTLDFYPQTLRPEIDAINTATYTAVNNGVYRCGFATAQAPYEAAYAELFTQLDRLEEQLATRRYLTGNTITEADWRLFTTLIRFDAVYVSHFKCNRNRISDMPNLSGWLGELYQWPKVAQTVNIRQIKQHYFASHETINPTGIVPLGPLLNFENPHGRDHLEKA